MRLCAECQTSFAKRDGNVANRDLGEIMMTGNIKTASANDPAIEENPTLRSCTISEKAKSPIKMDGAPAIVWATTRSVVASLDSVSAR